MCEERDFMTREQSTSITNVSKNETNVPRFRIIFSHTCEKCDRVSHTCVECGA